MIVTQYCYYAPGEMWDSAPGGHCFASIFNNQLHRHWTSPIPVFRAMNWTKGKAGNRAYLNSFRLELKF